MSEFLCCPTSGIRLLPFQRNDLCHYVKAVNLQQINIAASYDGPIDIEYAEHWYNINISPAVRNNNHFFSIINSEGHVLGTVWLWNYNGRIPGYELSIVIYDPCLFNKGIGSCSIKLALFFAFTCTSAHRVWLSVISSNRRAISSYKKCGFIKEGVIRSYRIRGETSVDSDIMSILRSEWVSLNPSYFDEFRIQ